MWNEETIIRFSIFLAVFTTCRRPLHRPLSLAARDLSARGILIFILNRYERYEFQRLDQFRPRKLSTITEWTDKILPNAIQTPQTGVVMSDGEVWREQRRVSLKIMREHGMGQNIMEAQATVLYKTNLINNSTSGESCHWRDAESYRNDEWRS